MSRGCFSLIVVKYVPAGCSIPVVRVHGVHLDWVQFPAARHLRGSYHFFTGNHDQRVITQQKEFIKNRVYRLGDWRLERALPPPPTFLVSFILESRVKKPRFFRMGLFLSSLTLTKALETPWMKAPI